MASADKSLSVTYGAFSCTLSGYADPLPVLRAVAAQIRDLAEHEPDFGTIPGHVEARGTLFDAVPEATAADPALARDAAEATRQALDAVARPDAERPEPAPRPRPALRDDDDAALERLLARTDQALLGPETQRRHENIGHLRTAVEVTRAGPDQPRPEPDPAAPYRDALAAMVWPSRPVAGPLRTERPRPDLPRADLPRAGTPEADGPVAPRRVTAAAPDPLPGQDDFAGWARDRGAAQLPEVLEAAAAFLAERLGTGFSRPEVMQLADLVLPTDRAAREASFRAFGQLLREGRIAKADAGRYALGTASRFAPETAAG